MKIKKQLVEKLLTEAEEEEKLSEINPQEASVADIADAMQASVENETNGDVTLSDKNAEKVAAEVKETSKEIGAEQAAVLPPEEDMSQYDTVNELTKVLDKALASAKRNIRRGGKTGSNVLVTGLPGSGKTAIVYAWCASRGLNPFYLDAKDPNLETVINGMPLRDITVQDKNAVAKAYSSTLAPLHKENSVLFLDELNRQVKPHIRASLLTLINEKEVSGNDETGHESFRDTLLFTVACINPAVPTDKGAAPLNDAEKSRFIYNVHYDSTPEAAHDFFKKHYDKLLKKLDPESPTYMEDAEDYLKEQDIALYIVDHPDFEFDTREDLEELSDNDANMLNQRLLTDAIADHGGDKKELLDWVEHYSGMLPRDIEMLKKVLSTYICDLPALKRAAGIGVNKTIEPEVEEPKEEKSEVNEPEEDDADFFQKSSAGKQAATPGDAEASIMAAMANW